MNNVAIVSGGMDSVVMLYANKSDIGHVLNFYYGSKHNAKERPFARHHAQQLQKDYVEIDLSFVENLFKSDLLQSGGDIPEGHYADPTMKRTVVPFRNGIMLSIAAGFAESVGAKKVYYGAHGGDHAIYPDCRPEFFTAINQASVLGTYAQVEIAAPFMRMNKRAIGELGQTLNLDWTQTWTCYKGGDKHCGVCGACVERKEALQGFDSTSYIQ